MTQRAVEQALGRLVTDEHFRREFSRDPFRASFEAGFALTSIELTALAALGERELDRLGCQLDDRVCRLDLPDNAGNEDNES